MRVLIVEDSETLAKALQVWIDSYSQETIKSDIVRSLAEAENQLNHSGKEWDCVLLDLNLLDSGIEHTLSKIPEINEHAPVVVITGAACYEELHSLEAGAQDFLLKGNFTAKQLLKSLIKSHIRWVRAKISGSMQGLADTAKSATDKLRQARFQCEDILKVMGDIDATISKIT